MIGEIHEPKRFIQAENVRLRKDNRELHQEVTTLRNILDALCSLYDIPDRITPQTNVLKMLNHILSAALASIDANDGSLLLVDEETDELAFVVVQGAVRDSLQGHRIPLGEGIAGWVAQSGQPVMAPNVRADPRFSPEVDQEFHFHTQSLLCVPILQDEQMIGVIQALNKRNGAAFDQSDLSLFSIVAQLAATAITKAETIFRKTA